MYRLKLSGRHCISCGICMDVCPQGAISMRLHRARTIEGAIRSFLALRGPRNSERPPEPLMTFPYLGRPERCDGCLECVRQCPVGALALLVSPQPVPVRAS